MTPQSILYELLPIFFSLLKLKSHSLFVFRAVKMRILILLCFIVQFVACEVDEIKCIEDFLASNSENSEECLKVSEKLTTELNESIKTRFEEGENQTCVMNVFADNDINRLYLRGFVKHVKNQTEKYDEDIEESIDAFVNAAKVICTPQTKFDEDFEELFNVPKPEETSTSDRCVQKYFIDEKLVDLADFRNLNFTGLNESDCENVVNELKENISMFEEAEESANTFFGLSATKAHQCSNEKFKNGRVLEKIFLFQIIGSYGDVNEGRKEDLKLKYIDARTSSVKFLLECIREI